MNPPVDGAKQNGISITLDGSAPGIDMRNAIALILAAFAICALATGSVEVQAAEPGALPKRVTFMSNDGKTRLVGYVFEPSARSSGRVPAIVMMHGRAGAYSERAKDVYDASTLSLRHKAWGHIWAEAGYIAILVDGFGPRGYPQGFPRFSYDQRPAELDEVAIRPLDAYGALAYLLSRPDVAADRIALQGWSNGASATISAMSDKSPAGAARAPEAGFRAALAFYPACGLKGLFETTPFLPYAPTLMFHGTADEEVSYKRCSALVARSRSNGGNVEIEIYDGATHSFDSPGRARQSVDANAVATDDAVERSLRFFKTHLNGTAPR